jgi:Uma2 family endonuclease
MSTVARTTRSRTYGPECHGQRMSYEEFASAPWQEGYQYELIHGRVEVAAMPNMPHFSLDGWLKYLLQKYVEHHSKNINLVGGPVRVFVPDVAEATCPEPDIAAYSNFPLDMPFEERDWRDHSPILVIEIISPDNARKDLKRNVELYLQVPSIREYWIIDPRESPDRPSMIVYRRRGKNWQKPIHVSFGEEYTTKLLPEFVLVMDPHQR